MGLANGPQVGEVTAPVAFNQDIKALYPPLDSALPRYLLLAIRTALANEQGEAALGSAAHGTLKIDTDALLRIEVPLPTLDEQRRIVAVLDEAFASIDIARANAEKNLQNARELFPAKLAEVFRNSPSDELTTVEGVARVFDGPHATPKTVESGPVFLGISSLVDGDIDLSEARHVTQEDFQHWTRRVKPQADDVVFSYETRLGQAALIPVGLECCLGRRMGLLRPDPKRLDSKFLVYQYISPIFRDYLSSKTVRGATVDRISIREFPSFRLWVPSLAQQRKHVQALHEFRSEAVRLESIYQRKLAVLDELKQSLLHEAFSGKL
jgi:type I restriction enzyme S subunit